MHDKAGYGLGLSMSALAACSAAELGSLFSVFTSEPGTSGLYVNVVVATLH